ncbi:MAG: GMC oxidoreductase, partial [Caulobacteraceae bacterium]
EGSPKWGSAWKQAAKDNYLHAGRIESQMTNMAYRNCFLDLDPTYRDAYGDPLLRLTFDWQDNELKLSEYQGEKLKGIAKAMGATSFSGRILKRGDHWDTRPYQSTHINGGTSMGVDPKTSVVNKYLQSWDVPNVFVQGANVFAHGISYNPTGLIGALAYWSATHIRETYLKNPGPMVQA